jgi:hypothetical protein
LLSAADVIEGRKPPERFHPAGTRGPLGQRVVLKAASSYHIPNTCVANDAIFLESWLGPPFASHRIASCV